MINSLFVITEKLSALSGKSYLDSDILKNKRILLLLNGGIHQHAPLVNLCTKSFSMLPLNNKFVGDSPVYPIDILLSNLNVILPHAQPGFMVCSTESLIFLDLNDKNLNSPSSWQKPGVSVITMDVGPDYYTNHGVCRLNEKDEILEIAYKRSAEYLSNNGFISKEDKASIYTGLVFFCQKTTEKLLYLHNTPPLDSCTYLGVDSGSQLLKFGVFPDILCAMTKHETLESYLNQPCFPGSNKKLVEGARKIVWKTFRDIELHSIKIKGNYYYFKNPMDFLNFIHNNGKYQISRKMHSFIATKSPCNGVVINSILLGNGKCSDTSIIYSSVLSGNWSVGEDSIVFGAKSLSANYHIKDRMIVNEIRLKPIKMKHSSNETPRALLVLGIQDDLNLYFTDPNATIANRTWEEFLKTSGIAPEELWSKGLPRILRTARLFPIIVDDEDEKMIEASLWIQNKESPPLSVIGRWKSSKRVSICDIGNIEADFQSRREISFQVDSMEIENILVNGLDQSINPFIHKWDESGIPLGRALENLDRISFSTPLQFTGRLLSCISDTLAIYVNNRGGLRSGPAKNYSWEKAFNYFRNHDERKGFLSLIKERTKWLNSNENMIRAARHYEGAGQIVIKNIVDTCQTQLCKMDPENYRILQHNEWVCISLPVRIDLAGGWLDAAPICYEHGGNVINAAVSIRGKNPIECKVRRINEPVLIFNVVGSSLDPVVCSTLLDLLDYDQPHAPASLLKSCFLQLGLIDYSRKCKISLKEQLEKLGGGIEVRSTSNLPTGSGLGTSSILAAGLIYGIAYAYGYKYSDQHLFHAVLKVEQMLTTGGGWQDQVGGVLGGFKEGKCSKFQAKGDHINVTFEQIQMSNEDIAKFNQHLLLVYTGRTRLARDLLQDVVRRWYAKTSEILDTTNNLLKTTEKMRDALSKCDIEAIGKNLIDYWNQKKTMAAGAEPSRITELFNKVKDLVHGYSLAGAGGGGFMLLITKEDCSSTKVKIENILKNVDGFETVEFFEATINTKGLETHFEKVQDFLTVPTFVSK
ncbi:hypothetical protein DICPUDRAFT_49164 [Dictyostelium purpureum]|uniref:L-fucose kinase n=1 Tax=Dictyostelium purpureum TaxID=5786 RepID=F0ZSJ1_DICPU|nr:uncharacterized protein DICPUDRAFT_49164 [Dictyostelium purpureum]EGC33103.1 hypothetical protein DICPUDRAFT_49164 [Dictyostelium purpureum]|eukprot:XP_003290380.1 hypothetical protein DICPUDRAFT_49164 [Dictyostelium purpureum]